MLLIVSHEADDDLQAIWKYIGIEKGNADAANRILLDIRDAILLLPRFPHLGRSCPEFHPYVPDLKCMNVEGYVIYYRIDDEIVYVGRIVHSRREQERIIMAWHKLS